MKEVCSVTNNLLVIRLDSDLDHHIAQRIREEIDRKIMETSIRSLAFDFRKVNFMDSSGIGMIMGRYKKVIFTGGKVGVASVSKNVDRIFRLSGLYKIIGKYETVTEAIKKPVKSAISAAGTV